MSTGRQGGALASIPTVVCSYSATIGKQIPVVRNICAYDVSPKGQTHLDPPVPIGVADKSDLIRLLFGSPLYVVYGTWSS